MKKNNEEGVERASTPFLELIRRENGAMPAIKLSDTVYSVGVQNPDLRIFDIVMRTEFGTTYNSFLIRREKTILVESAILLRSTISF